MVDSKSEDNNEASYDRPKEKNYLFKKANIYHVW